MHDPPRPATVFDGFFSDDHDAVVAAVAAVDALGGPGVEREDDVDDAGRFAGGFSWLAVGPARHPLRPALTVPRVPVTPPSDRPHLAPFTSTQKVAWPGPLNLAWRDLVRAARRRARLVELRASPALLQREAAAVDAALAVVVEWTRHPPSPLARDGWRDVGAVGDGTARAGGLVAVHRPAPDELRAVFVDRRRLCIQRGFSIGVFDVVSGARLARPMGCARWLRSAAAGRYLCFDGWQVPYADLPDAVFDLDDDRYLADYPDAVRAVVVDRDHPPWLQLRDRRTARVVEGPEPRVDAPPEGVVDAASRDGKFVWLGDAKDSVVVDVDNGIVQVRGPRVHHRVGAHAFCVVDDDWRFFADGFLYDEAGVAKDVGFAGAVAYDVDGGFVRAFDGEFVVHDVEGGVVRRVRYEW